jgi:hypothetical protein
MEEPMRDLHDMPNGLSPARRASAIRGTPTWGAFLLLFFLHTDEMKAASLLAIALFGLLALASATVHFQEDFDGTRFFPSLVSPAAGNATTPPSHCGGCAALAIYKLREI